MSERTCQFDSDFAHEGQLTTSCLFSLIEVMKKRLVLFLCLAVAVFSSCQKILDPLKEIVDVKTLSGFSKLYVLNEGKDGANNASLDCLVVVDGNYQNGVYRNMNPQVGAGLGDVANDIAVYNDQVWIVVNKSGLVNVLSAKDDKEIGTVSLPTPRHIALGDGYAYVTSWNGASSTSNPRGTVYKISTSTRTVAGSVEVGYQPEGVTLYNGKLYVANSGGLSAYIAPDYAYDNTVSVIDASTMEVVETIPVQVNLKYAYSDGKGSVYVTSMGNFNDIHSGLYRINVSNGNEVTKIADYVSVSSIYEDTVYYLGTEQEFDWTASEKTWKGGACTSGTVSPWSLPLDGMSPYGLLAIDRENFLVSDAGDYVNPGTIRLYNKGVALWTEYSGVCPGHFAIW